MNSFLNTKVLLITSLFLAIGLSFTLKTKSVDEQFINIAVNENLADFSPLLEHESIETKAILLDYADNQELVLTSLLALKKYPSFASEVFTEFGQETEFKQDLVKFGHGVVPVIAYFLKHEDMGLTAQETLGNLWQTVQGTLSDLNTVIPKLTAQQRGWYAINAINQDGYNFLGQFALDKNQTAHWVQTDRAAKALTSLFSGGIRDLEAKYQTGEKITQDDVLWASADAVALVGSIKLLKAGKRLASANKPVSLTKKAKVFSAKLVKNKSAQDLFKRSATLATAYLSVTHPELFDSLLSDWLLNALGINPDLVKMVKMLCWAIVLFIPLLLLRKTAAALFSNHSVS